MFKIIRIGEIKRKTTKMSDMLPCQIGIVWHPGADVHGHLIMRTAREEFIEVMDLTSPGPSACWTFNKADDLSLDVEVLPPGVEIILVTL